MPRLARTLPLALLAVALAAPAHACGPVTHATVAARVAEVVDSHNPQGYRDFLARNHGPHDTGAITMDVFWGWGDDMGNAAHSWTYLDAFRDLLLEEVDLPLDEDEERKIAFYLGLTAHHVSDWHWHGKGGEPDAFIWEAMDQDGVLQETAELGIDVFMLWEEGERAAPAEWWYPSELMLAAIHAMGYTELTQEDLDLAMALFEVSYLVEREIGYFSYLGWKAWIPWSHENHITYAPGGLVECVTYGVTETLSDVDELREALTAP